MPDKTYSLAETRSRLGELAERAAGGETLVITRRGKPIARLSPPSRTRKPIDPLFLRKVTERMPAMPKCAAAAVRRMRDDARY